MKYFLCAMGAFFWGIHSFASGISTNGGTPTADQTNVWFLGENIVEYCVETNDFFDHDLTRRLVRESIDDWIQFFQKYNLDQLSFSGLGNNQSLRLSLNFREIPRCTSPENQIRFLFGVESPEIKHALEIQRESFGLSYRGAYNHTTYRTGGQVFVRGLPYGQEQLKHILLHEIGHVFGMEHDSVYVMDSRVADFMQGAEVPSDKLGQIESTTWPYRFSDHQTIEFSLNGRKEGDYEPNFAIVFLRDLFGFPRDGYHNAKLVLDYEAGPVDTWRAKFSFRSLETKETQTLVGQFSIRERKSDFKGLRGPSLYTNWNCRSASCHNGVAKYQKHLDPRPSGMEAEGMFIFGDTKMPALFEQRKGFGVKIFVPKANMWWTSENYMSSTFAR